MRVNAERAVVDAGSVRALMRAFQLECEGVVGGASRHRLPSGVAGYFWPDDQATDGERDGRSPLGVVLARIGVEMDNCGLLSDDERLLLSRRHGLAGAVRRLTTTDPGSMLAPERRRASGRLRPVEVANAWTTLHRAYWHLAQTFTARPDARPTLPSRRANPALAPWFVQHTRSLSEDQSRHVVSIALDVARQWCAVGGSREVTLFADLSCWHDCVVQGVKPLDAVNLRGRLRRANAYVGIALYSTIVHEHGLSGSVVGRWRGHSFTSAPQLQCMSSTDFSGVLST